MASVVMRSPLAESGDRRISGEMPLPSAFFTSLAASFSSLSTRQSETQTQSIEKARPATKAQDLAASPMHVPSRSQAVAPLLTRDQLITLRCECSADDVPIDHVVMGTWSEAQAQKFFETGGLIAPREPESFSSSEPSTPEAMIKSSDSLPTPPTFELVL